MEKSFGDVFSSLELSQELASVTEDVTIFKMAGPKTGERVKIYIKSNHIITRKQLNELSLAIKKQILKKKDVEVIFVERYNLSSAYTVKSTLNEYKDSIIDEFKDNNEIIYHLIKNAKFSADDEDINIEINDTIIARSFEKEIKETIEAIFTERLGVKAEVNITYKEKEEKTFNYNDYLDRVVDDRISEITNRLKLSKEKKSDDDEMMITEASEESKAEKKSDSNSLEKKSTYTSKQSFSDKKQKEPKTREKRWEGYRNREPEVPDDPDVFYGKSVDGVFTPLYEACTELGGFAVRARIENVESRDTKSGGCIFLVDI